jgi:hypothetical protein
VNGLRWGRNRSETILTKLQLIQELPLSRFLLVHSTATLKKLTTDSRSARDTHLLKLQSKPSTKINKHKIALTTWRALCYLKDSSTTSTLEQLEIPADWSPPFTLMESITSLTDLKKTVLWQSITSPSEIEYYLILRNRLHFGQAQMTPFAKQPLRNNVSWGADTRRSEEILNGAYIPPESVTKLCAIQLEHCKRRSSTDLINPTLTMDSFKGTIRKWRETTTTSPSGCHLGRYKSLFA